MAGTAIDVRGIAKSFGDVQALSGLSFTVPVGTVCCLLGSNGAGKSTAVRILSTLTRADSGRAVVAGFDVGTHPHEVRRRIGVTGQQTAVDEDLTTTANLVMTARLFGRSRREARSRADELLSGFGLADKGSARVSTLSGGSRRKVDLAAGLIGDPEVLFLDEPTTGLDLRSRRTLWSSVRRLADRGTTVLLTTQYLDEADVLADRIVVVRDGRAVADSTPSELKKLLAVQSVIVEPTSADDLERTAAVLAAATGGPVTTDDTSGRVTMPTHGPEDLETVAAALRRAGIGTQHIALTLPSLDDVFLSLTGDDVEDPADPDLAEVAPHE